MIGKENVLYDDGCDHVVLKSIANGKYLEVSETTGVDNLPLNYITSEAISISNNSTFKKYDWGFNFINYKNLKNNMFVTENVGVPESTFSANVPTTFGWFGFSIFHPEYLEESESNLNVNRKVVFKDWQNKPLKVDPSTNKLIADDKCRLNDNSIFEEMIV